MGVRRALGPLFFLHHASPRRLQGEIAQAPSRERTLGAPYRVLGAQALQGDPLGARPGGPRALGRAWPPWAEAVEGAWGAHAGEGLVAVGPAVGPVVDRGVGRAVGRGGLGEALGVALVGPSSRYGGLAAGGLGAGGQVVAGGE